MFSLSSSNLRFNGIKQRNKDLMMNNLPRHLSARESLNKAGNVISQLTLKLASPISSRLSPILVSSLQLSLMLTLLLMTLPSFAEQSYSIGQSASASNKLSAEQLMQAIKHRVILGDSDQTQNKALARTRDEVIKQKKQQAHKHISARLFKKIADNPKVDNTSRSFSDGNFVIYEGYAQLIADHDLDGYYQTFSVTFDADLITYNPYDVAVVYAELYLSENGGPWQHYYTTDSFVIQGESSEDAFEVYSTLSQGFNPNHYDVLIDLYEVGYTNIIASYSSDDSNSLYALPLESSDYDIEYVEYYQETHIHGGSASLSGLMILMMILAMRQLYPQRKCCRYGLIRRLMN
ncbi:choice-of-anchor H family protein [Colwellia sp. TT2012]|uniref:choice-of-anchor H family protein n=1 Tax=Colwellia sp. TT2012 TaxID=1720342 RepID=UPI000B0616A6|nr:choice-of-anchor H family protein [Colwellia sp. TT2012]